MYNLSEILYSNCVHVVSNDKENADAKHTFEHDGNVSGNVKQLKNPLY